MKESSILKRETVFPDPVGTNTAMPLSTNLTNRFKIDFPAFNLVHKKCEKFVQFSVSSLTLHFLVEVYIDPHHCGVSNTSLVGSN